MTWHVEQAHEPPHAPSMSKLCACAMSKRLSPSATSMVFSRPSLEMKVIFSSSPGFGLWTWPCKLNGEVLNRREAKRCPSDCFKGFAMADLVMWWERAEMLFVSGILENMWLRMIRSDAPIDFYVIWIFRDQYWRGRLMGSPNPCSWRN